VVIIQRRDPQWSIRMSDPFNILPSSGDPSFDDPGEPQRFEDVVQSAVAALQESVARFGELYERIPEEHYTDDEWRVVEMATNDVMDAVERAEEGYVAVQYDSHAWYRILENLEQVQRRLESAMGIMARVADRGEGER
jgi:hypothetical protein